MMKKDTANSLSSEMLTIFEETFTDVKGYYLDKGTSLFETLEDISHSEASEKVPGSPETIAGHIFHMAFYIKVLQEYITDERTGKTDWNESWVVTKVSEKEWFDLKSRLSEEYQNLVDFIKHKTDWDNEDYIGGILSILAHCSLHLGHTRQLISLIRAK